MERDQLVQVQGEKELGLLALFAQRAMASSAPLAHIQSDIISSIISAFSGSQAEYPSSLASVPSAARETISR